MTDDVYRSDDGEEDDGFPPQEDTDALIMERTIHGDEAYDAMAYRLFEENVYTAALSIIQMAVHGSTERIKFEAAKYVVDRVLGRIGDLAAFQHATRLPERQGELVAGVIQGVLADLNLTDEQQERAGEVAASHLMSLAASGQKAIGEGSEGQD